MIIIISIFGLIFRLFSLNQSFWLDEATSGVVVRDLSFVKILTNFTPGDFHPPLYYILLKVWSFGFGTTEVGLRLFSVLAGILIIILIYKLVDGIFNKQIARLAAVLSATSPLLIYYSQEVRMYTLVTLFTVLAFYFFTKVEEGRANWILFSITLVLIFFTDYLAITAVSAFWVFGFLFHKSFSWWKKFLLSQTPLILGFILWLPVFKIQFLGGLSVKTSNWWNVLGRTTLQNILLIPDKFILGRITFDNKLLYSALFVSLSLVFGFLILFGIKKVKTEKEKLIALWLFVPVVIVILIGFEISVLSYFRLLFVIPAFYILLAVGISKLKRSFYQVALAVLVSVNVLASTAYLVNPKFQREDWRGLVKFVETNRAVNSEVLFPAYSQMEGYIYYDKNAKIGGPASLNPNVHEIWLIRYVVDIYDPTDTLKSKVESFGFKMTNEYNFNGIPVFRYEKH